jgi:hypothetical protein
MSKFQKKCADNERIFPGHFLLSGVDLHLQCFRKKIAGDRASLQNTADISQLQTMENDEGTSLYHNRPLS